jgi:hypothetical protein
MMKKAVLKKPLKLWHLYFVWNILKYRKQLIIKKLQLKLFIKISYYKMIKYKKFKVVHLFHFISIINNIYKLVTSSVVLGIDKQINNHKNIKVTHLHHFISIIINV